MSGRPGVPMIVIGRIAPVGGAGDPLRDKEAPVTYRNTRILLTICGGLLLVGQSALLAAAGPSHRWDTKLTHRMVRLPSVLKLRVGGGGGDVRVAVAAESALSVPADQTSYLTQPEYTQSFPGFAGPVPPAAGNAVSPAAGNAVSPAAGGAVSLAAGDTVSLAAGGAVPVERLVEYVLGNNPEIQAARYRARALGARVPQAASLPDPQLGTITFLQAIQTAAGPQEVALGLSQHFPLFGKLPLRSQVAYHDAMSAYARVTVVELGAIERVKRAYYDVYFLQRAIEVTRALEPRIEEVIEIAKTKYETGLPGAGLETVYQAEIELSALKIRLVDLGQTKIDAQARLAGVLHLPPQTRIEAVPRFDPTKVAHTARLLVELAESYQPELEARRREISRDRTSIALARRDYWPDATVSFNWFEIGSRGLSPVATGEDAYALLVGVNLPIYRKRLDAAVREAQYNSARSARQYAATLDEVRAEVLGLYAKFTKHNEIYGILGSEIVPRAERTLELAIATYKVGRLEFQQVIQDYDNLLKYEIEYYQREALREQAIASLERAVGSAVVTWPLEAADDSEPPLAPVPRADR